MEFIDPNLFEDRSAQGLASFLSHCKDKSKSTGQTWIACISLQVADLDALAVLDAIYERGEKHFYLERSPEAVSGAESIIEKDFHGPDRIDQADQWVRDWSGRILVTGDAEGDFFGPLFFGAFPFSENSQRSAFLFLPRWQVCRSSQGCSAVANTLIDQETDIEAETRRIIRAHQRLSEFGQTSPIQKTSSEPTLFPVLSEDQQSIYEQRVQRALEQIRSGSASKLVISRYIDLQGSQSILPLETLHRLRESFPNCFSFSTADGSGTSWIASSPERLVQVTGERFATEAIAGSRPRGSDFSQDAALGRELTGSEKDLREHQMVVESILRRLQKGRLLPNQAPPPHLIKLANVQHLRTPLAGKRPEGVSSLQIAGMLHPTPAVGGVPRDAAMEHIREVEGFDRELYGGFVGWTSPSGDGEWVVAIRTAKVHENQARLFAGAGIVEGSHPAAEWQETEVKIAAVRRALEVKQQK